MALINLDKRLVRSFSGQGTAAAGRKRFGVNRLLTGPGSYTSFAPTVSSNISRTEPENVLPRRETTPITLAPEEGGISGADYYYGGTYTDPVTGQERYDLPGVNPNTSPGSDPGLSPTGGITELPDIKESDSLLGQIYNVGKAAKGVADTMNPKNLIMNNVAKALYREFTGEAGKAREADRINRENVNKNIQQYEPGPGSDGSGVGGSGPSAFSPGADVMGSEEDIAEAFGTSPFADIDIGGEDGGYDTGGVDYGGWDTGSYGDFWG